MRLILSVAVDSQLRTICISVPELNQNSITLTRR